MQQTPTGLMLGWQVMELGVLRVMLASGGYADLCWRSGCKWRPGKQLGLCITPMHNRVWDGTGCRALSEGGVHASEFITPSRCSYCDVPQLGPVPSLCHMCYGLRY